MPPSNSSASPHYVAGSTPMMPLPGLRGNEFRQRTIQVTVPADMEPRGPVWTYPGQGSAKELEVPQDELHLLRKTAEEKPHQLGEWMSTSICGNDILSSVLYSSGHVAVKAGKLAPIPMMLVALVLYFFRFIYEEVVTAIPLNGGSYNVLLNTTSKRVAAFGAALGILSYLATAVVSSTSAVHYLSVEVDLPLVGSTVGLLFVFAVLNALGISESAVVAFGIFSHHVVVLSVLSVSSIIYVAKNPSIFRENMSAPLPQVDFAGSVIDSNVAAAIFFGFGAAMLGVTGFESSAQFVEEQKPGVFRKTLRNMWAFASGFNTLLSFMAIGVLPVSEIYEKKDTVLAEMGRVSAGHWLEVWVAIDAFVVLSGAVLTAYVGITGLVRRLACDRVLPAFLLKQNPWRKTNHFIIFLFFAIASSLVIVLKADNSILAGVYTYSFLGLMALFSFGCMVMKAKRAEIPREVHAPWWTCIFGFILVILGILANLLGDPKVLTYFALYLIAVVSIMMFMLERVTILKLVLAVMKTLFPSSSTRSGESQERVQIQSHLSASTSLLDAMAQDARDMQRTGARGGRTITKAILDINDAPIVFFCKHPDMTIINKAILYVRKNEQTSNLRVVHVYGDSVEGGVESGASMDTRKEFENIVALFGHIYPKLKIDFVSLHGLFEPATVKWVSETMHMPTNMMFIAQPGDKSVHKVATLGLRVITG
ncbi:hypothetical protein Poli38472_001700 [Pythium oligandrum]|uniref:Transmembrane protein n=1 Tax=Pythium oligandrum TaxID=41045 RepID=A0A8K1CUM0_PYTOL|nr:hypothetical protein Poli38472_001700 [Pythium oligandrum]|eukprot:TMW69544.1 hypothetical protein Poli38472_001700 [Pythium oligandrum]